MRMTTQEIVQKSEQVKKFKQDWKKIYAVMYQCVQKPNFRIIRHNNSLFFYQITAPGDITLEVLNADKEKQFKENILEFLKAVKVANIRKITTITKDILLLNYIRKKKYKVDIKPISNPGGTTIFQGEIYV